MAPTWRAGTKRWPRTTGNSAWTRGPDVASALRGEHVVEQSDGAVGGDRDGRQRRLAADRQRTGGPGLPTVGGAGHGDARCLPAGSGIGPGHIHVPVRGDRLRGQGTDGLEEVLADRVAGREAGGPPDQD